VARLIAVEAQTAEAGGGEDTVPAQTGQQLKRALGLYRAGKRGSCVSHRPGILA